MTDMTGSSSPSLRLSEFDDFLFAQIGDEKNGMTLTVLSALARQDVDPWEEAAALTRMPEEAAADRLAILIATLPDRLPGRQAPKVVATRLVALLPRQVSRKLASRAIPANRGGAANVRIVIFVVLMTFLLSAQFFMRGRQPVGQTERTGATASSVSAEPSAGQ
jgi:hypothetical protein